MVEKDEAVRRDLVAMEEMSLKKGATPEYLLALAAEKSPAVADALARKAGVERDALMALVEEYKRLYEAGAARDERLSSKALDAAAEGARKPGSSTTINK